MLLELLSRKYGSSRGLTFSLLNQNWGFSPWCLQLLKRHPFPRWILPAPPSPNTHVCVSRTSKKWYLFSWVSFCKLTFESFLRISIHHISFPCTYKLSDNNVSDTYMCFLCTRICSNGFVYINLLFITTISEGMGGITRVTCNPVDYSPPGSSVYRIIPARTLE